LPGEGSRFPARDRSALAIAPRWHIRDACVCPNLCHACPGRPCRFLAGRGRCATSGAKAEREARREDDPVRDRRSAMCDRGAEPERAARPRAARRRRARCMALDAATADVGPDVPGTFVGLARGLGCWCPDAPGNLG